MGELVRVHGMENWKHGGSGKCDFDFPLQAYSIEEQVFPPEKQILSDLAPLDHITSTHQLTHQRQPTHPIPKPIIHDTTQHSP